MHHRWQDTNAGGSQVAQVEFAYVSYRQNSSSCAELGKKNEMSGAKKETEEGDSHKTHNCLFSVYVLPLGVLIGLCLLVSQLCYFMRLFVEAKGRHLLPGSLEKAH